VNKWGVVKDNAQWQVRKFLAAFSDLLDEKQTGSGDNSVVERHLANPLSAFNSTGAIVSIILADVDIKLVEKRLSIIYNTL
jgi:hypothetical protein